jgi:lipoprotein-anchoring transpeptidase ErfK/SrfK
MMLNHLRVLLAAMALAVLIPGGPVLAQYSAQGPRPDVRADPVPPVEGNWMVDDDDDDDARTQAPAVGQRRGEVLPSDLPSLPPAGMEARDVPPRPPGDVDFGRQPLDQASAPSSAVGPRPGLSNLASLPPEDQPELGSSQELPAQFRRQLVSYETREPAGTIVIDTSNTFLYLVLGDGKALRYGIGVGREGFAWAGAERISRMAEWPDWHPPAEMIERQPYLPRFMAGGEGNPLGARALYLGHTLYRIHGTNQPSTIGTFVSSGCIRLVNGDIADLYSRVQVGARVVVLPGGKRPTTAAN